MKATDKKRILTVIFLIGFICITMVIMTAYAAELRCENNALISSNEALQSEVETLQIRIKTESNIEYIEHVAKDRLGMVYPTQDDCVYLKDSDAPSGNFSAAIRKAVYN